MLPIIRENLSFIHTTLPQSKLAIFMMSNKHDEKIDLHDEVNKLTIYLLCFKHKMKIVWTIGSSGLHGQFQSTSKVCITHHQSLLIDYFNRTYQTPCIIY